MTNSVCSFPNSMLLRVVACDYLRKLISSRYNSYTDFGDLVNIHKSPLSRILSRKEEVRLPQAKRIVLELSRSKEEALDLWILCFGGFTDG